MVIERHDHRHVRPDQRANALQRFTVGIEAARRRQGPVKIEQNAIEASGATQPVQQSPDIVIIGFVARRPGGAAERIENRNDLGILPLAAIDHAADAGIRAAIPLDQRRAGRLHLAELLQRRHFADERHRLLQKSGDGNAKARRARSGHLVTNVHKPLALRGNLS
jgi:hypothetical protein